MNIVLYEPEIPANTGNIGRTCVVTGTRLHLIEPLGFSLAEKDLKRAGLDYWKDLDVTVYSDYQDFLNRNPGAKVYYASTKARHIYTEVAYGPDDYLMFGKESAGIPEEILVQHPNETVRIPMNPNLRSLNLSNSVAILLYEALRQQNFPGMQTEGELHRLHWEHWLQTFLFPSLKIRKYPCGFRHAQREIPCSKRCMLGVSLLCFYRAPRSLAKGRRSYARAQKLAAHSRIQWFACIGIPACALPDAGNFGFSRHARCRK